MSANNFMLIAETKKGYLVSMRDADTGCQLGKSTLYKTLRRAVLAAQEEGGIEYGLHFILKEMAND